MVWRTAGIVGRTALEDCRLSEKQYEDVAAWVLVWGNDSDAAAAGGSYAQRAKTKGLDVIGRCRGLTMFLKD